MLRPQLIKSILGSSRLSSKGLSHSSLRLFAGSNKRLLSTLKKTTKSKTYSQNSLIALGISITAIASIYSYNQSQNYLSADVPKWSDIELTPEIVSQHNKKDDCWVVIKGQVYDLTDFLTSHPGGQKVILRYAGKDATKIFVPIHPPDSIDKFIPPEKHLGPLIGEFEEEVEELSEEEIDRLERIERKPPLSQMINLHDFETIARQILPPPALAYYCSAADDEVTLRENHNAYHRIFFNPKILVDVKNIDLTTEFFGDKTTAPFYISATALAKLGNPEGEVDIARGAGREGIHQMISTLASCSFDEIADARVEGQNQWYQLYVNADRSITEKAVRHAEERGMKGLFITVDAPSLGRREKDMKMKFEADSSVQSDDDEVDRSQGAARAISSFIDPSLSWKDIGFIQSITKMPIVIKGVQRKEDVFLAIEHGLQGVVLSNHGGRQLDYTRAPVEVLAEVMPELRAKGLDKKIEIYIDGGVRRGTDVLKALCLGAKGVGLGRPFLYANSSYGDKGVQRAIQLLKDELEMNMRLLGVTKIEDLGPELLDTRNIYNRSVPVAKDYLYEQNYGRMAGAAFRPGIED
ncbi:Cytochrome b2, mitochondrial [Wickerhamomyces ciferrii]|uniref:L-lactate dehydrogenase (cytochrome) n=1 Tax=Wickerhamomyces ciferrii (strain ATCC 14091 / BCRC 22168 / CBS 111 / JCM 3599 / NBRC 0793 / NRRL Y-1031 F-60-10) TaxID=1206466 RepID=K0KR22_WICCF|nr:Cytochrome b2, mitochondrial [Wickerhamomyces ciferrii]CCH43739.1 Cytochrome b2, mitochondrial [Wickerhamomyces ciferrii]